MRYRGGEALHPAAEVPGSAEVLRQQEDYRMADDGRAVTVRMHGLTVMIPTGGGVVTPTDHVSVELRHGEVLGIVGETGSGKTVTCRAMLGLLPAPSASFSGVVSYPGLVEDNILALPASRLRQYWGDFIAMVPQNPMTSLNPIQRVGDQIAEAVTAHSRMSRRERDARVLELMRRVGIPAPEQRRRAYPHQFSGGMLQRTLIAIALAGDPQVLIADEPTTALDAIIQAQILQLLLGLQRSNGMSLVLVSHDLGVIAEICDRVGVMYAGQVVELARTQDLLDRPRHPYTAALLQSMPASASPDEELATIAGSPPQLINLGSGCRFAPRCEFAEQACGSWETELLPVRSGRVERTVRCRRQAGLTLTGAGQAHEADPSTTDQASSTGPKP